MLNAFIGSVLNGLLSGFWIAFFTGWISWLSVIRILAAGFYELYLTVKVGADFHSVDTKQYKGIGLGAYPGSEATAERVPGGVSDEEAQLMHAPNFAHQDRLSHDSSATAVEVQQEQNPVAKHLRRASKPAERTVSIFGWLGWIWSAIYTPISHSIWLAVHITSDSESALLIVRALAIGVSALGLTFDYKHRYGAALARRCGSWAFVAFNVWNSTACLLLGCEAFALLVRGAMNQSDLPVFACVLYAVFSCIWAAGSWVFLPPIDGARPGFHIVADVFMGAFAGIFVAAPAFTLWQDNKFKADAPWAYGAEPGMGLSEFLQCQGASVLEKVAAVLP